MIDVSNVCYYCGAQSIPNFRYNGVKVCPEHAPADEAEKSAEESTAASSNPDFVYLPTDTVIENIAPVSPTASLGFVSCPKCNPNNETTFKVDLWCDVCNGNGYVVVK